jgi:hypothetical protein
VRLVRSPLKAIGLIAESSSRKIFGQRTFEFNMFLWVENHCSDEIKCFLTIHNNFGLFFLIFEKWLWNQSGDLVAKGETTVPCGKQLSQTFMRFDVTFSGISMCFEWITKDEKSRRCWQVREVDYGWSGCRWDCEKVSLTILWYSFTILFHKPAFPAHVRVRDEVFSPLCPFIIL